MTLDQTLTSLHPLGDVPWEQSDDDELFTQPYVDIDEDRGVPVPHRYVHGGFRGTDTRFSFYFPPTSGYEGRFFQHATPVPQSENLAQENTGSTTRSRSR